MAVDIDDGDGAGGAITGGIASGDHEEPVGGAGGR
jgi:hypothetical protein